MTTIYFKEGRSKEMYKLVNIYPQLGPITSVSPAIRTAVKCAKKSTSDIYKCLVARARVEEILPDGTTKQLTLYNYRDEEPVEEDAVVPETEPIIEEPTEQEPEVVEEPTQEEPEKEPEVTVVDISNGPQEDQKEGELESDEDNNDEDPVDTFDMEEL